MARAHNIIVILLGFLAGQASWGLAQDIEEATALSQQVSELYKQGRYSEAVPLAQRAIA